MHSTNYFFKHLFENYFNEAAVGKQGAFYTQKDGQQIFPNTV